MWFDARAKLAKIAGHPPANSANPANSEGGGKAEFAEFAEFATPQPAKPQFAAP
jgi:hypothetical protein